MSWFNSGWIRKDRENATSEEDEALLHEILRQRVFTYPGTSQYVGGSASACGLASMNAVRCILELENRRGLKGLNLLETVATKPLVENVVSICSSWKSSAHLEMDDIHALPLFSGSLELHAAEFKRTDYREMLYMLDKLQTAGKTPRGPVVTGLVLTRPPEIISIINIPTFIPKVPHVLVLFDSHPRDHHPKGAAFIFFSDNRKLARYIADLWHVDSETLRDSPDAPWENQLLTQFSGHFFVSRDFSEAGLDEEAVSRATTYEANTQVLDLKHQLQEQTSKATELGTDKTRLVLELNRLRSEKSAAEAHLNHLLSEARSKLDEAESRETMQLSENTQLMSKLSEIAKAKEYAEEKVTWMEKQKAAEGARAQSLEEQQRTNSIDSQVETASTSSLSLTALSPTKSKNPFLNSMEFSTTSMAADEKNPFKRKLAQQFPPPPDTLANPAPGHSRSQSFGSVTQEGATTSRNSIKSPTSPTRSNSVISGLTREHSTSQSKTSQEPRPDPDTDYVIAEQVAADYGLASENVTPQTKLTAEEQARNERDQVMAQQLAAQYAAEEETRRRRAEQVKREQHRKRMQEEADRQLAVEAQRQFEAEAKGRSYSKQDIWVYGSSSGRPASPLARNGSTSSSSRGGPAYRSVNGSTSADRDRAIASAERKRFAEEQARLEAETRRLKKAQDEERESIAVAARLQAEDERVQKEHADLLKFVQETFHCVICLEDHPLDIVAPMEGCGHRLCRESVKDLIVSKLGEHRFPILCPICAMEKDVAKPGVISGLTAQIIGLSEEEYTVWQELEMAAFSTLLDCPGCHRQAFVDRDDLKNADTISCPLNGCRHRWCKNCQQTITDHHKHSCDGTAELDRLMKTQGWKYCPGCNSPMNKTMGCNHMTCPAPGCNMHFCWICGKVIVQSVLQKDIKDAMSRHYSSCRLFDDVAGA